MKNQLKNVFWGNQIFTKFYLPMVQRGINTPIIARLVRLCSSQRYSASLLFSFNLSPRFLSFCLFVFMKLLTYLIIIFASEDLQRERIWRAATLEFKSSSSIKHIAMRHTLYTGGVPIVCTRSWEPATVTKHPNSAQLYAC